MRLNIFRITFIVILVGAGALLVSFVQTKEEVYNVEEVVDKMFASITKIKTIRYSLKIAERVNGKIENRESKVKLQVSPRKLYLKIKNQEVLWVQGTNGDDALVNPGAFPYINLTLDPMGSLMRKGQHHTINEMGFNYIYDIIKNYKEVYGNVFKKHFFIAGEELFEGRLCYKLSVLVPDFSWKSYTVLKGENLVSIARKLHVSEFMILERNPSISWYDAVKAGQVIQVPNKYAKYALLLIDKELMLPVCNTMIDDKGLFEFYQYSDVKVNIPIAPEEFTKNYKGYHF